LAQKPAPSGFGLPVSQALRNALRALLRLPASLAALRDRRLGVSGIT